MAAIAGTVVFLGAGASSALGLPLTSEILPEILSRLDAESLFEGNIRAEENRRDLKQYLDALLKASPQKPLLITDLLSLVDHAIQQSNPLLLEEKNLGPVPYRAPLDPVRFRSLLEHAIYDVLRRSHAAPDGIAERLTGEAAEALQKLPPPKALDDRVLRGFVTWIARRANACERLSIVTTNYDLIPERLWKELRIDGAEVGLFDVDFGFSWRDPGSGSIHQRPTAPRLGIYKLHGSLNWLRCALCDHTYINQAGDIAWLGFDPRPGEHTTCHCTYWPLRHVIVAPSMVRDIRDPNILQVWMAALEAMRLAEQWYVIGYSLPPEDLAIRSLLIRAYQARGYTPEMRPRPRPEITAVQKYLEDVNPYHHLFEDVAPRKGGLEGFLKEEKALSE